MWNKFVDILQEPATKRLGLAIVISASLHAIFFGNMDFSLPTLKKEMHLIEARIQMPKVVPQNSIPPPETVAMTEPEQNIKTLPEANIAEPSDVVASEAKSEAAVSDAVEAVLKPEPIAPESIVPPQMNAEPESIDQVQPEDIGLVINENAYQYIETEFDVRTEIDGSAEGKAKIIYNLVENKQYQISWVTKGTGIMALLFPELLQTSEGVLTKSGLQPTHYLYQFGKKADKTRSASFDWQAKKVTLQTAKGTKTEDLPDDTQDLLSFMYQFMYVAPLQHMQLPIVNGKKLHIYDYSFEGEEQVNSPLGELKTLHILHSGNSEEEKTELWLAIDYQYAPVKIRKIESDGSVVEMLATRITTNRPVINQ
ncbi:MAG TPA: DUF3108 domain-containing protein [Methylotenera sp.]|nr:DUF3108 domain-containing protein [Methylotenera sp.]